MVRGVPFAVLGAPLTGLPHHEKIVDSPLVDHDNNASLIRTARVVVVGGGLFKRSSRHRLCELATLIAAAETDVMAFVIFIAR